MAVSLASVVNQATQANVDVLPSNIAPAATPAVLRLLFLVDQQRIARVVRTIGSEILDDELNEGIPLVPNAGYIFEVVVGDGELVNFRLNEAATVVRLELIEN